MIYVPYDRTGVAMTRGTRGIHSSGDMFVSYPSQVKVGLNTTLVFWFVILIEITILYPLNLKTFLIKINVVLQVLRNN